MKKLILIIFIIFSVSSFSKKYQCLNSLEKDRIKLEKMTNKSFILVEKAFSQPNKIRIDKSYKSIKKTEEIINHIIDDHYLELKEKDIIILLKAKLKIYKTKRELYLLKKTLVIE